MCSSHHFLSCRYQPYVPSSLTLIDHLWVWGWGTGAGVLIYPLTRIGNVAEVSAFISLSYFWKPILVALRFAVASPPNALPQMWWEDGAALVPFWLHWWGLLSENSKLASSFFTLKAQPALGIAKQVTFDNFYLHSVLFNKLLFLTEYFPRVHAFSCSSIQEQRRGATCSSSI